jgi:hypothetical protein
VHGTKVFTCWSDERNVTVESGDADLYFVEVLGGSGTNILVGDDGSNADQKEPAIGVDAYGHPYLVWTDGRESSDTIYYGGCAFTYPTPLQSADVAASEGATVGPETVAELGDVSVTIPPGALPSDVEIMISEIRNPVAVAGGCVGACDFGPSGIEFLAPVTITIPYAVSASGGSATPTAYWYDPLTGAVSQDGISDIEHIVISSELHALRFTTTHFTPFYVVIGGGGDGGGSGGGCAISPIGDVSVVEFLLPYLGLAAVMFVLRLRDHRARRAAQG